MYNVIMYAIQVGISLGGLFNEKLRKMWRGEQEAVRILREKVEQTLNTFGFMRLHWANLNKVVL